MLRTSALLCSRGASSSFVEHDTMERSSERSSPLRAAWSVLGMCDWIAGTPFDGGRDMQRGREKTKNIYKGAQMRAVEERLVSQWNVKFRYRLAPSYGFSLPAAHF